MVLVALLVVIMCAAIGYGAYLLTFMSRGKSELGFMQSLGMSRQQLMGLLSFEHGAIAVLGIGLGAWAGFQMSNIMVSSVIVEARDVVLPSYVFDTSWGLIAVTFGILAAVFGAAFLSLYRGIGHIDFQGIARVE